MVCNLLYTPLRLQMWHGRCFCEAVGYCLRRQCPACTERRGAVGGVEALAGAGITAG